MTSVSNVQVHWNTIVKSFEKNAWRIAVFHALTLFLVELFKGRNVPHLLFFALCAFLYFSFRDKILVLLPRQRMIYSEARNLIKLVLGFDKMVEISYDDFHRYKGWNYGIRAFNCFLSVFIISFLWEGRVFPALQVVLNLCYLLSAKTDNELFTMVRMTAIIQFLSIIGMGNIFTEEAGRRAMIIRLLCSLSTLESVIEIFIQFVGLMTYLMIIKFGWACASMYLPIMMFCFIVLPAELFGLRYLLARWLIQNSFYLTQARQYSIVTLVIPFYTILCSFGSASTGTFSFYNISAFLHLLIFLLIYWKQNEINLLIQPTLTNMERNKREIDMPHIQTNAISKLIFGDENKQARLKQIVVCNIFACVCGRHFQLLWICLLLFIWLHFPSITVQFKRKIVLISQLILFYIMVMTTNDQQQIPLLVFSTSRIWLVFENRLFSKLGMEICFLNFIQILTTSKETQGTISAICNFSIVAALASRLLAESGHALIFRAKDADSFVDHALKQKFAALGIALGHVLESSPIYLDTNSYQLLLTASNECRIAQNSCYISSFVIQYQASAISSNPYQDFDLYSALHSWSNQGVLSNCFLSFSNSNEILVCTDKDLLKAFLSDLTKKIAIEAELQIRVVHLNVQIKVIAPIQNTLKLSKDLSLSQKNKSMKSMRKILAQALGGLFVDGDILQLPIKSFVPFIGTLSETMSPENSVTTSLETKTSNQDILSAFPSGLTIAIVDDNNLVRRSIKKCLEIDLKGSSDCFVTGDSLGETLTFIDEIISKKVDIAIFDENLDYGDEHIKGTFLANQARIKGFQNCLILHSANKELSKQLDPVFNGFVEKTALKVDFMRGVVAAWESFMKSKSRSSKSFTQE